MSVALRFVLALLVLGAPPALSQTRPAAPGKPTLSGKAVQPATQAPARQQPLARARFLQDMDSQFRLGDADRDGVLSRKELELSERARIAAEAQARNRALFLRLDVDRNGAISPGEFAAMSPPPPPTGALPATLTRMDANRDGKVSLIEHRAATLVNFDRLDADKDGYVSPAEMKAGGLTR